MSQEVPTQDILFGAVVLSIFLVIVFTAGWLLTGFKNRRFVQAWKPLVPLIQGTVTNDGGGAATSWLTGTYHGHKVRASMIPDRNRYSGESGSRYNYFDLAVLDVAGKQNWRIEYHTPLLGMGNTGWRIVTSDALLEQRLRDAGVMELVEGLGRGDVSYSVQQRTLLCSDDVTPQWLPAPERFITLLDVLVQVAQLSAKVNAV